MDLRNIGTVDLDVSDLFFNQDLADAIESAGGGTVAWDMRRLAEQASTFIGSIERLAPTKAPSVRELVQDFMGRQ